MNIDTSIVNEYLSGSSEYKHHWLYKSLADDGTILFDEPSTSGREAVKKALEDVLKVLGEFHPYNSDFFCILFPKWQELCATVNIIISVGCPAPYDAMVREQAGTEYIIMDLIRLNEYNMDFLSEANKGSYWEKYGAICGMLYLALHIDDVETIYRSGPDKLYLGIKKDDF